MSGYGPPGPYQGQPQDPWQQGGGQQPDPYGPAYGQQGPPDQYGQQGPPDQYDPYGPPQQPPQQQWGQPQYSGGGGYGDNYQTGQYQPPTGQFQQPQQPPYGQPPPTGQWGPPVAPPQKKGSGGIIAVVVVLALLLCGGGAAGIWYVLKDDSSTPTTAPPSIAPTSKSPSASTKPSASARPSASASATGGVAPGDAKTVKVGECLTNLGTATAPNMKKVACATGAFKVLKRLEGTSDKDKCEGTAGYTHNYFYQATPETFSFVLCMQLQK